MDYSKEEDALQRENSITGCDRTRHWNGDHQYFIMDVGGVYDFKWTVRRASYNYIPKAGNKLYYDTPTWIGWFPTEKEATDYVLKYLKDRADRLLCSGPRFEEGFSGSVFLLGGLEDEVN